MPRHARLWTRQARPCTRLVQPHARQADVRDRLSADRDWLTCCRASRSFADLVGTGLSDHTMIDTVARAVLNRGPPGCFSLTMLADAATDLIAEHWGAVVVVAEALLEHGRLDYRHFGYSTNSIMLANTATR